MATICHPRAQLPSAESLLKRYGEGRRRRKMEPIYQAMLAQAEQLAEPKAVYQELPRAAVPELSQWLTEDTVSVVFGLCTLGATFDDHLKVLSRDDLAAAVVLEEIALAVIVGVTREVHGMIRSQMQARRLKAGPAYRPGLGRWPLETQRSIFTHLPAAEIGVFLNEQMLMTPIKSTSLIIPVFDRSKTGNQLGTPDREQ